MIVWIFSSLILDLKIILSLHGTVCYHNATRRCLQTLVHQFGLADPFSDGMFLGAGGKPETLEETHMHTNFRQ